MKRKRKAILWTSAVFLVLLCALLFLGGDTRPTLDISTDELRSILQGDSFKHPEPQRLPLGKAIKDPAYLKMRGKLLFGAKLKSLVTTNAMFYELAPILAYDSDAAVIV